MERNQQAQPETGSTAIDFRTQLAQAKALAQAKMVVKETIPMNVFNMLQDMRHLIIIDFRQAPDSRIRHSLPATLETYRDLVAQAMAGKLVEASKLAFKGQYAGDILRRLLFVMPTNEGKTDAACLKTYVDNINGDLEDFAKAMAQMDPSGQ